VRCMCGVCAAHGDRCNRAAVGVDVDAQGSGLREDETHFPLNVRVECRAFVVDCRVFPKYFFGLLFATSVPKDPCFHQTVSLWNFLMLPAAGTQKIMKAVPELHVRAFWEKGREGGRNRPKDTLYLFT